MPVVLRPLSLRQITPPIPRRRDSGGTSSVLGKPQCSLLIGVFAFSQWSGSGEVMGLVSAGLKDMGMIILTGLVVPSVQSFEKLPSQLH